jgi:hypothetical protein
MVRRDFQSVTVSGSALTAPSLNVYEASFLSENYFAFSATDGRYSPQIYLSDGGFGTCLSGSGSIVIRHCRRMDTGWHTAILRTAPGTFGCAIRKPGQRGVLPICHAIRFSRHGKATPRLYSMQRIAGAAYG